MRRWQPTDTQPLMEGHQVAWLQSLRSSWLHSGPLSSGPTFLLIYTTHNTKDMWKNPHPLKIILMSLQVQNELYWHSCPCKPSLGDLHTEHTNSSTLIKTSYWFWSTSHEMYVRSFVSTRKPSKLNWMSFLSSSANISNYKILTSHPCWIKTENKVPP